MRIPTVVAASGFALGVAASPGGRWKGWHGGQKWGGWTTKTWGTMTWSEPWPSPTASYETSPTSYVETTPTTYVQSTPTTYVQSTPTTYAQSTPTTYVQSTPTTYVQTTPTSYVTSAPTSYATSSPSSYTYTKSWGWPGHPQPPTPCLNSEEATQVANVFRDTIASPFSTPLVQAAFSPTFNDYSDSVIELINSGCATPVPLGSPTFNSLAAFIAGQSSQAPIPFTILNIWYGCNSVHLRWVSQPGPGTVQPEQQVTGIIAIEVVPNTVQSSSYPWLIQTVYSEFNSGAWLYDLGVFVPTNCSAAAPPAAMRRRSVPML